VGMRPATTACSHSNAFVEAVVGVFVLLMTAVVVVAVVVAVAAVVVADTPSSDDVERCKKAIDQ
jgi:uncharacterized membrane protein